MWPSFFSMGPLSKTVGISSLEIGAADQRRHVFVKIWQPRINKVSIRRMRMIFGLMCLLK